MTIYFMVAHSFPEPIIVAVTYTLYVIWLTVYMYSQDKSRYWPGLGGSDTDYGWVLGAHPLFEAGTLPLTVIIVHRLPFCFLLYTYLCLAAVGGVMYALAESVWIAFAGRALMGAGISVGAASIHTYIGEMGTMMDNIRENQGKKPRKFLLYIAHSFALNGGIALPYSKHLIIRHHIPLL